MCRRPDLEATVLPGAPHYLRSSGLEVARASIISYDFCKVKFLYQCQTMIFDAGGPLGPPQSFHCNALDPRFFLGRQGNWLGGRGVPPTFPHILPTRKEEEAGLVSGSWNHRSSAFRDP